MGISDDVIGDVIKLLSILNPHILNTAVPCALDGHRMSSLVSKSTGQPISFFQRCFLADEQDPHRRC